MPDIRESVALGPATLGYDFSGCDPRLNPGLRQLIDDQLAIRSVRPCLYGPKFVDRLAQEKGKLIKLALSKYRELVFYKKKRLAVTAKACVHFVSYFTCVGAV